MRVLILRCGPAAQGLNAPAGAEVIDLPQVPARGDLRVLDAAARAVLPEDPTPSLDEIAARPDVRHLGAPGPAPQAPFIDDALRVVVVGSDAALSAVLTRAMRADFLWVEFGYVPVEPSPAATNWALPVGAGAFPLAVHGAVNPAPLNRSDRGLAVAGSALLEDFAHGEYTGEIIVDDATILFRKGEDPVSRPRASSSRARTSSSRPRVAKPPRRGLFGARLVPMTDAPGIAAAVLTTPYSPVDAGRGPLARLRGALRPHGEVDEASLRTGRAVQSGGRDILVTVDGVPAKRPVKRATFYRHMRDLQIVRP
ncbi:hypothetical protein QQA02_06000 [Corynebacterium sp. MSK006]|uniref:hypothetical protein n=1 Tax=Corynebacterium sp. MSK006 TaxID=3050187 RepID=UPI00254AF666|nr:hypothetical protein [Corynebacterium sp. MSK006]MDK8895245.1 hypothetical protein [Corynebacterium sp. MSK006]